MVEDIVIQKLIKAYGIEGVLLVLADVCEIEQEQSQADSDGIQNAMRYEFCASELQELVKCLNTHNLHYFG